MPKFRKKPIIVEAIFWTGQTEDIPKVAAFFDKQPVMGRGCDMTIEIDTLEGKMIASPGDWIIRGTKGELYPCKPDIFDAIYEYVER